MKKTSKKVKPYQLSYNLHDLLSFYPISPAQAFYFSGVHRATWNKWLAGTCKPPRATIELIRLRCMGALPDPAFNGFTCRNGLIIDETGTGFTAGDIRSIPFFRTGHARYVESLKQISELQATIRALQNEKPDHLLSDPAKIAPNLI
jgi:hypothetical protein